MIEINLLPEDMRQAEGTPPARLAIIIVGVAIACVTSFFITKYYVVEIPKMLGEIKNRDVEIADLKKRKEAIDKVTAEIEELKTKVATLDKLIQSRVRFARVLDRLCDAVPPEGAWFRSFNVTADSSPAPISAGPSLGKRYMINLTGYTVGNTDVDRVQKLSDLMMNLEKQFRERDVDKRGINMFLNARFDRPRLVNRNFTPTINPPQETDPKVLKALKAPKEGIDFVMSMSFELFTNTEAVQ
jgi:hypothetical protein